MTTQEAITDLEKRIQRLKEIIENGEYGCVDVETWEKFTMQVERYELYLSALREKLARDAGCDECYHAKSYNTNDEYPCKECFRGGKSDRFKFNAPVPKGDAQ